jgi:hypothetical protein
LYSRLTTTSYCFMQTKPLVAKKMFLEITARSEHSTQHKMREDTRHSKQLRDPRGIYYPVGVLAGFNCNSAWAFFALADFEFN